MNASIPVQFLNTNPNSKATFRPGGDAQFVSYLLGGIINEIADFGPERLPEGDDFESYIRRIAVNEAANLDFSPALKAKYLRAAHRIVDQAVAAITKADVKAARKAAKQNAKAELELHAMEGHLYKIGRWTYAVAEGFKGGEFVGYYRHDKKSDTFIPAEGGQVIDA